MSRGTAQSFFWQDENLGVLPEATTASPNLGGAAAAVLLDILKQKGAASGDETLVFVRSNAVDGTSHLRFTEAIREIPVDGASLVMHVRSDDGVVYAVNGEFVSSRDVATQLAQEDIMDCISATDKALRESGIEGGEWSTSDGDCDKKAIMNDSLGKAHVCWKRAVSYGGFQRDLLYASTTTGKLVARIPTVMTGTGGFGGGLGRRE
jgi:Zn-dependent metalloprotease